MLNRERQKEAKRFVALLIVGVLIAQILPSYLLRRFNGFFAYAYELRNVCVIVIKYLIIAFFIHLISGSVNNRTETWIKRKINKSEWIEYFCGYYFLMWIGEFISIFIQSFDDTEPLVEWIVGYIIGISGMKEALENTDTYMIEEGWQLIILGIIITPIFSSIVYKKMVMDSAYKYGRGTAFLLPGIIAIFSVNSSYGVNWMHIIGAIIVSMYLAFVYGNTGNVRVLITIQAMNSVIQLLKNTYWGVSLWVQIDEAFGYLLCVGIDKVWGLLEIFILIGGIMQISDVRKGLKQEIKKQDLKTVFCNIGFVLLIAFFCVKSNWYYIIYNL